LERALGLSLFTRSPRGLAPTDAAFELRPHAQAWPPRPIALLRAASGSAGEARGVVRVTTAEIIGVEVLPPILTAFRARYPGVTIELSLTNVTETCCSAGRHRRAPGATDQDALVASRSAKVRFRVLRASRLSQAPWHAADDGGLRGHALIGFDKGGADQGSARNTQSISREAFAFRSDSGLAQLALVRAAMASAAAPTCRAPRFEPRSAPRGQIQYRIDLVGGDARGCTGQPPPCG